MHDLEHCVSRRDTIFMTSLARETKVRNGAENIKFAFNRKLDDARNKVKQLENVRFRIVSWIMR